VTIIQPIVTMSPVFSTASLSLDGEESIPFRMLLTSITRDVVPLISKGYVKKQCI